MTKEPLLHTKRKLRMPSVPAAPASRANGTIIELADTGLHWTVVVVVTPSVGNETSPHASVAPRWVVRQDTAGVDTSSTFRSGGNLSCRAAA
jgi:hypothetical protein